MKKLPVDDAQVDSRRECIVVKSPQLDIPPIPIMLNETPPSRAGR